MKIKLVCCLTVFILLLTACGALFSRYNDYMSEWKGQDEDHLYLVYGPPMRKQELKDGRILVAYDYKAPSGETMVTCEVRFTLQGGVVQEADYTGNYGAVSRFVKGPNN